MIRGNLCYIVYPKSGSTSTRNFLSSLGFSKPLGTYGHESVKNIEEKTGRDDYIYFSTYLEPEKHIKSSYKWIMKNDKYWIDFRKKHSIKNFDDYLNYLENFKYNWRSDKPDLFTNYVDFFNNRKVVMMKPDQIKPFLEKQLGEKIKTPFPRLNKSSVPDPILTENQKERIKNIYTKNIEYIKENKFDP